MNLLDKKNISAGGIIKKETSVIIEKYKWDIY